ncbi:MAG: metallophosphoesterase family protein [Myxococcaceae bacterium]|nr:MAG: metallophosphoesterase family protein [Myxococcaceae bacterium]
MNTRLPPLTFAPLLLVAIGCGAPEDDAPTATVVELDAAPPSAADEAPDAAAPPPDAPALDAVPLDAPALDAPARDAPPLDAPALDARPAADAPGSDAGPAWSPPVERGAVTFPYRAYQCRYSIRAVSPGVRAAQFHADVAGAAPRPRNLHLTFAGDPSSSVVIQWSTDAATAATEVRFGERAGALDRVARGFSFTYAGGAGRRQHEVHLCGLAAGRTYYYDAGGGAAGGRSAGHRFVTAPAGPSTVRAIVTGDSRTNPAQWAVVARRALAEGADLLVLSGDAVADGASQAQWDALFDASPELFATLPAAWSNGNHEYLAEPYLAQFALPDHGGARGVEQWYALTYGPLRLVALNDTVAAATDVSIAQVDFLRATLGSVDRARTPWVLGLHHQPMYTTSASHGSNAAVRGAWAPLFDRYHVNADLAGHVHSYESTRPLRGGTSASEGAIVPAAMGTRYFNFGGGGAPLYGFAATRPWIRLRESTRGYAVLTATATTLTWTAKRDDGTVIETVDLAP